MSTELSNLATDINAEIKPLIQKLNTALAFKGGAKVTFISASEGEGTTTIATAFALALHEETGKRVLLVSNGQAKKGIVETFLAGADVSTALKQVGAGVYGGCWTVSDEGRRHFGRVSLDKNFWSSLQSLFDVIVIDAPALQTGSDGVAYARISNATILVVEAESTRKQVVENLRDTLTAAGAKIAGIVMNKREFHIPESVYKHL
jgi:hypothetical protein